MATTTHWAPNSSASSPDQVRAVDRRGVDAPPCRRPARSSRRASSTDRTPPPTVKGMNTCSAVRGTTSTMVRAVVRRGGDVEEDQLVGALGVVAGGQLHRVPGVDEVDEPDALDHPAGVDVEAGDHPDRPHAATPSSTVSRPSTRARPVMAPPSPRHAGARRSTAGAASARGRRPSPRPPRRPPGRRWPASTAARPSRSGPLSVPSRSMAVTITAASADARPARPAARRPSGRCPPPSPAPPPRPGRPASRR